MVFGLGLKNLVLFTSLNAKGRLTGVQQISSRLQTALQRQIHFEYNKTATAPQNVTGGHDDDVIDHVTIIWDAMQTKVSFRG